MPRSQSQRQNRLELKIPGTGAYSIILWAHHPTTTFSHERINPSTQKRKVTMWTARAYQRVVNDSCWGSVREFFYSNKCKMFCLDIFKHVVNWNNLHFIATSFLTISLRCNQLQIVVFCYLLIFLSINFEVFNTILDSIIYIDSSTESGAFYHFKVAQPKGLFGWLVDQNMDSLFSTY